jgi:protoporphyrinogen oxidase
MSKKTAVIIGAGPAGLTAAYELLKKTDIHPIVLEKDPTYVGGISRTVNYKGNRIDIGGHRFFSKSDRVMHWWAEMLPVKLDSKNTEITYQRSSRALTAGMRRAEGTETAILEVRPRKTRIMYNGKFFAYPVELSFDTLRKLGLVKVIKIGFTYVYSALFPRKPENTLEDFFINRFGTELYKTFFESYTAKVWGVPCRELSAEWGAQRVKGLSIAKAILHAARKVANVGPLSGKSVETSLIEQFLYPTLGPGQMWEVAAQKIKEMGGEIKMGTEVVAVLGGGTRAKGVVIKNQNGVEEEVAADYVFSTADIKSFMRMLKPAAPARVLEVSDHLEYRDFITVGLLLKQKPTERDGSALTDTWMYVHEPGLQVGRIQLFHNWHPDLVANKNHGWIGLEYFCKEGDALWSMSEKELIALGTRELEALGLSQEGWVLDGTVIKQPKAYPGYLGTYAQFKVVQDFLDNLENVYAIGRNGMHRYNNQDHSMLAAMEAVEAIQGKVPKSSLWHINTEQEYHESK